MRAIARGDSAGQDYSSVVGEIVTGVLMISAEMENLLFGGVEEQQMVRSRDDCVNRW